MNVPDTAATEVGVSASDLWGYIGQLEEVLATMDDRICGIDLTGVDERERHHVSRLHYLLGAAQTIAESLAVAARVR